MKYHQCDQGASTPQAPGCLRCGGQLASFGTRGFRFGGMTGAVKLVLGEWAELGEDELKLEVLACPACRRIEFQLAG